MDKEQKTKNQTNISKMWTVITIIVAILGAIMIFKPEYNEVKQEQKITSTDTEIKVDKTVARIDLVTPSQEEDVLFEVYVNDSDVPEKEPEWLSKLKSHGYVIRNDDGKVDILVKIIKDIDINIYLRGKDQLDKSNKMVENWVKYTSLAVDGKEILSEPVEVWHNKPFKYVLNAKEGENYRIHIEWQKPTEHKNEN